MTSFSTEARLRELYRLLQSKGLSLYAIQQKTGIHRAWSSAFLLEKRPNPLIKTVESRIEKLEALLKETQAATTVQ